MLTGKSYEQITSMIDCGAQTDHHATWKDLYGVLKKLGWQLGEFTKVQDWAEVHGVAIVHVEEDHFILYDADNGCFYDPD